MADAALPIDPLLPEIVSTLRGARSLVLEAPPGAGKTTRVPRALLEAGLGGGKEIVVLQPRRLPTRLAAQRVSEEIGERVGDTVGYQVRFEDVRSAKTRLSFVTEGVLGRRLLSDPTLRDVGIVVLDEFHERHLSADISLALLRRLQETRRPDLKLVVMSATLEAEPVRAYLGGCPSLRSQGRRFDVSVEYLPAPDDRHLDLQVLSAIKRLFTHGVDGDVLVFLPGAGEIRRTRDACAEFAERHDANVLPLHGDLSPAEQDRAVRRSSRRKIILSTNVAETSVTIDGVAVVIDTGLARVASHSPWSGLPTLKLSKVSRASAIQRAGRAGRTRAGHCIRLYTQHDFDGRPEQEAPEIRRMDLAETVLSLRASGVVDLGAFPFFEPPPAASLDAAETLLRRLGAVDPKGIVTDVGQRLLRFPVHPRQGRVIVEGERRGVGAEAATLAALMGERDIRREARANLGGGGRAAAVVSGPSDLLELLERFREAERAGFASGRLHSLSLEQGAVQSVDRVQKQLRRTVRSQGEKPHRAEDIEQALMLSVLAGYPDRVARRRRPRSPELLLFGGGTASLSELSVVQDADLMVAVDAEERPGKGAVVRLASSVEPEWLLDLYPETLEEVDTLQWNAEARRVERLTRLSYGNLMLEETRAPAPASEQTARVLVEAALAAGPGRFADPEALQQWRTRVALLTQAFPEAKFPTVDDAFLRDALASLCSDARSFKDLEGVSLLDALYARLTSEQQRLLATHAPERVTLPGGRGVKVNYEPGKPPWVESRLQDFFGMAQGPSVCAGRVSLVLHLLAPNMRAVQVTTDLAGFWERHYPALRKELGRKYPRHSWPEDPRHAQPPAPRPPRR
ncbi:ATP-dependent helicase HrpB [Myxococcus llanfairpwllgwyngyllgogerychwyrndrobwllllantysiliogogogochensis]|uniref:ATP-dependent helicase HrpB n=1 Tax=Myxococcus llanfairpwllgwyngyllgogerychwyrndrobwllllantysiliogogogochensis TaxID=2590453 RepID=A0A540X347_9BACT|nr:ATP-dependent helicase HrpB [Myxococcus llanfairpwllgwyngyllgogerychwyrndrobwllllantysiliogogogochensis]TQF15678.1 ATP-dependent helicase HrpB [Myxococcus llanfairpwllgwyngyllgogerychwyrndrobwllllantysiliogogogochensis]